MGRWSVDGRMTHRADKGDFGSGEQAIPAANLLSAGLTWRTSPEWTVALSGSNLLDDAYHRSADDKASLQRVTREAKAAAMLRHLNIVTVYTVGEQHGINYIATIARSGDALMLRVRREGRKPLAPRGS